MKKFSIRLLFVFILAFSMLVSNLISFAAGGIRTIDFEKPYSDMISSNADVKEYNFSMSVKGKLNLELKSAKIKGANSWKLKIVNSSGKEEKSFDCNDTKPAVKFSDIALEKGNYKVVIQPISVSSVVVQFMITSPEVLQNYTAPIKEATSGKERIMMKINDPYIYGKNGEKLKIDSTGNVYPVIVGGRTMLPIRAVINKMGSNDIQWDAKDRKVTMTVKGKTVSLWVDKNKAVVNGVQKNVDVPPTILKDRTFVPIRFVTENMGASVQWLESSRSILIEFVK